MLDLSRIALVFPGQASQEVGMGRDIASDFAPAREIFEAADAILGFSLSTLCFEGPEETLNDTINTQPALFTCGMAIWRVLQAHVPGMRPAMMAGHSLGEFTALAAADVFSFEDGLRLVRERGRLMKEAGERQPGAMAAILGLETAALRSICEQAQAETGGVVILANDNCPGQLVISGDDRSITTAMQMAADAGAKRTVRLAVSIAAHSPLMESAAGDFRAFLANIPLQPPAVPVYGNVSAAPLQSVSEIRQELETQLTQSVRWTESVQAMVGAGAQHFVELGPKDVLTGLIKRIDRGVERTNLYSALTLHEILGKLA